MRLEWSPTSAFEDRASYFVVNRRLPVPKFTVEKAGDALSLKTDHIHLLYRPNGKPFDSDNLQVDLLIPPFGVDGAGPPSPVRWKTGEPAPQNLLGTYRTLDGISGAADMEPGILTRSGWSFVDDSKRILFTREEWPWATPRTNPASLDWYLFVFGKDYTGALRDFISIGGRIPMPPRWAFGAWWSRYWAYSEAELRELVAQFEAHGVPLDVLVIDMDWHLDGWTGYTFNPKYFPDPDGFMKWCREKGLKVTLNLHPADGVGKHEAAFADVCKAVGVDPATTDRVPFSCIDKKYMRAYFDLLHRPLEARGVDFWWIDWQQGVDSGMAGLDPLPWLNHLHWEDWTQNPARNKTRPILFSRWGGLGNHRYQVGFSGDTFCDWPSLAFQPYFTATAGNVGYAYWSHDIGGHQPGPVEPELYTRWIQWGILSPVLRTHTTKNPLAERRIWEFPKEYFEAMRDAWLLRYELIPYLYTAARQCYGSGMPLCRPMYYEWPNIEEAYSYTHEYMLGDDLLCAPITAPRNAFTGCATAKVWIPPGTWVHWFTGQRFTGPQELRLPTPLQQIPLFARAGSVIPMDVTRRARPGIKSQPNTTAGASIAAHVVPGKAGMDFLFEDDGVSVPDPSVGEALTTLRILESTDNALTIQVAPRLGKVVGLPAERSVEYVIHGIAKPDEVEWFSGATGGGEGKPVAISLYDDASRTCTVMTPSANAEHYNELRVTRAAGLYQFEAAAGRPIGELVQASTSAAEAASASTARLELTSRLGLTTEFEFRGGEKPGLDLVVGVAPAAAADTPNKLAVTFEPAGAAAKFERSDDKTVGVHRVAIDSASLVIPQTGDTLPQTTTIQAAIQLAREGGADPAGRWTATIPVEQSILPSINGWWIAGPFEADAAKTHDSAMSGLTKLDTTQTWPGRDGKPAQWHRTVRKVDATTDLTSEFFVNFRDVFGWRPDSACAYCVVFIDAPAAQPAQLALGSDDGVTIWLNGAQVYQKIVGRPYTSRSDRAPIQLKQGRNALVLRIDQGTGDWGFGVHVETMDGRPLPGITSKLD
ncbi:MAG: glycoside hydrolase family 31 protein [Phycisphaerae bacterium]|nr:glycoside hydrolase family 31 protein [Phycisphaerae bacterium]